MVIHQPLVPGRSSISGVAVHCSPVASPVANSGPYGVRHLAVLFSTWDPRNGPPPYDQKQASGSDTAVTVSIGKRQQVAVLGSVTVAVPAPVPRERPAGCCMWPVGPLALRGRRLPQLALWRTTREGSPESSTRKNISHLLTRPWALALKSVGGAQT